MKDDGTIEGLKYDKGHEELVMNIANENCSPPIRPQFKKVTIPRKGDVYIINVPKRTHDAYYGVKAKDGIVYFSRAGSTIREMQPHELSRGNPKGVKTAPYTPSEKGLLLLTEKLVSAISTKRRWSFTRTIRALTAIGGCFIIGSLILFFGAIYGKLGLSAAYFPWLAYTLIALWLGSGTYLCLIPAIAYDARCPACRNFFKFKKTEREILNKRTVDDRTEEWKVRYLRRCDVCGHEEEKTVYEEYDRD